MTLERLIGQFQAYVEYPDTYVLIGNRECRDILKYLTECRDILKYLTECRDILKYLTELPKTGRWIGSTFNVDRSEYFWNWECSECGWEIYDRNAMTNYCPSCGAKMERSDE